MSLAIKEPFAEIVGDVSDLEPYCSSFMKLRSLMFINK
jgi:hypothetical protein